MTDSDGLSGRGAALFSDLSEKYEFPAHEAAILMDACRTLCLIDRLESELADAPTVVLGSMKQPMVNSLFTELRQQRIAFASLLGKLALPDEHEDADHLARQRLARKAARARWSGRGA